MLQRAASNAYTWWWASHIRTNQSKWLDNNLQEMEEKVKHTLSLIEEDADSFRKKAEMYYQRRPELIEFVQEAYKSYRALAERYDHLSGELHKANNTIASVYPDQVHFGTDDVDEDSGGVPSESRLPSHPRKAKMAKPPIPNQPVSDMSKATSDATMGHSRKASQMNVVEAEEEIDKLQKEILSLQTEKVFVKSSYERGMANYMEIERKITETQERVCNLQDEFSAMSIDDDEARAVMVATALKSCEDTLVNLNEQQHKCNGDAKVEFERIRSVKDRIKQLGFESLSKSSNNNNKKSDPAADSNIAKSSSKNTTTETNPSTKDSNTGDDLGGKIEKRIQVKDYCEKIRGTLEQQSEMCVVDLAETIDDLVNKVINLEATVSSYESQIERLRLETDEAHKKLDSINASSGGLADDDKDKKKSVVKKTVDELAIIDELEKSIRNQGRKFHIEFRNTYKFFFDLSRKLDNEEIDFPFEMDVEEEEKQQEILDQEQVNEQEGLHVEEEEKEKEENKEKEQPKSQKDDKEIEVETKVELKEETKEEETKEEETKEEENLIAMESISLGRKSLGRSHAAKDLDVSFKGKQQGGEGDEATEEGTPSNWQHLFLEGLEDREKILLAEYTSVLRNYRETRKKLTEAEKKNQEHLFKSVSQMKQLRNAFLKKDEEIQSLKNRLSLMEAAGIDESLPKSEETSNINKEAAAKGSDINRAKLPSRTMSSIPLEINMEILDMVGKDLVDQINAQSRVPTVEERFRKDIDNLLDENLEFWLRFSSSFQQIQKYQLEVEQLHCKILGLKQHATSSSSSSSSADHNNPSHSPATMTKRSEASLIYKHLKDLESDLSVWIEQNALLKEELQGRCTSLEGIATEIERVSKKGMEGDEFKFTDFQASKFQGEVTNMQQENSKVANELQSGLDHVRLLQSELEKALAKLHEIEPSSKSNHANPHYQQTVRMASTPGGKPKIPLRSFLFGVKPKPKKTSIFSCMNQAFLQKQYSDLRPGLPH